MNRVHLPTVGRRRLLVAAVTVAGLAAASLQGVALAAPAGRHKAPKPYAGQPVTVSHWRPAVASAAKVPEQTIRQASMPAAGSYTASLAAAAPGTAGTRGPAVPTAAAWSALGTTGLAARSTGASPVGLSVGVLSADQRRSRGLSGLALTVQRTAGTAAAIQLRVPAALVDNVYGGDYAGRLRWVELPATSTSPATGTSAATGTSPAAGTSPATGTSAATGIPSGDVTQDSSGNALITAPVSSRAMVLAATAGPVSAKGSGSWAATDLKPSAQWGVATQTGSFTYSYPMQAPTAAAGPVPSVSLSYDSGSVDGETASTNNQPSAVGEGWSLTGGGYIERRYVSCAEDSGPSGPVTTSGDLCWKSDNGVLSFAGHSGTLVKDANPGEWRLQDDDGTIVKELTTCTTVTFRKDCWEVITTDGTQYYFGMNHLPGYTSDTATPPTNSVWTVPVYGNDASEPGYNGTGGTAKGTFATEATTEAWRWNLDYVVDPHGNAETLYYTPEKNNYAQNGSGATNYVRGGQLARIDYGMPSSAVYTAGGPADQVSFTYVERCKTGSTCSSSTPTTMPDVPWDQNCTVSPCTGKVSPTFWTEKMLSAVTTRVRTSATGYSTVASWALTHDYPATNDTNNPPALWLSKVQQTGSSSGSGTHGPATITMAPTVFKQTATGMSNRVYTADGYTQLSKFRISEVDTATGAIDAIQYAPADPACTYAYGQSTLVPHPDTGTHRCFLQWWTPVVTPPAQPKADLFNKYVVQTVTEDPYTGGTNDLRTETDYSYSNAAWRYDNSPFVIDKYRGWSVFAGFGSVEVRQGDANSPADQQVTDYTYYQGMDGDHLADGTKRTAWVVDSSGGKVADSRWLAGEVRETIEPDPAGGTTALSDVLSTPWASTVHADDGTLQARIVEDGEVKTTTPLSDGNTQAVDIHSTYDDNTGLVRTVSNDSSNAGSTCARTDYAQNSTTWLMDYPKEIATVGQPCGSTPTYPDDAISDIRTSYDNQNWGLAPTKGDATSVDKVIGYTGTTADTATRLTTATIVYDSLGRATETTDQLGRVTKTAYNPAANGTSQTTQPVTAITTTTDAQTGGLQWVTKGTYNPAWNVQISATDINNEVTTISYDALGRRSQVWLADRPQASYPSSPSVSYGYTDYVATAPAALAVATTTLTPNGDTITSYALYDGLARPRQTQAWAESKDSSGAHIMAGTVVTDTLYDSVGRVYLTSSPYGAVNSNPSASLIQPTTTIPAQVQTTYDAAGRKTTDTQLVNNAEAWHTKYGYSGTDRTDVTPPAGGTPSTTLTDARGRTTQLWQYDSTDTTGTPLITSYGYDARGDLTSMTDASRQNSWSWKFDVLGRQVQAVDPDTGTTDTSYDSVDRVISMTGGARLTTGSQPARVTLAYKYDDANRKIGEYLGSTSGTQLAGWAYDSPASKGQLSSSTSYSGGDAYTFAVTSYDALYRPLITTTTIPTRAGVTGSLAGTYENDYSYNPDGSLSTVSDQGFGGLPTETLGTYYTELGNPAVLQGDTTYLADASFTNTNLVSQEIVSDGNSELQRTFYYSPGINRLTRLLTTTSASTNFTPADNNYTYDNAGNVTSDITYADAGTTTQCFSYDHLAELTNAWTPASNKCANQPVSSADIGGLAPYWTSYSYDEATDNRSAVVQHNLTGGSDTTANYSYPAAGSPQPHVLTGVSYSGGRTGSDSFTNDPAGELTQRPGQAITYTPQGLLGTVVAGGTTQNNIYDADGNLLLTIDPAHGNTLYLGDTQLHTPPGQPSGTVTGVRTYSALGTPIAERSTTIGGPAGGTLEWLNADRNNTVTDELNNLTLATTSRHFDPFGNAVGSAPNWTSGHSYLNADTNQQANTVDLGARQYDPTLGRFLSPDPVLNPASPQQANGYSYTGNNPVTESDPTGACPRDICGDGGPAGNMSVGYQGDAGDTLGQQRKAFVATYTSAKKKMQQKLSANLAAKYENPGTAPAMSAQLQMWTKYTDKCSGDAGDCYVAFEVALGVSLTSAQAEALAKSICEGMDLQSACPARYDDMSGIVAPDAAGQFVQDTIVTLGFSTVYKAVTEALATRVAAEAFASGVTAETGPANAVIGKTFDLEASGAIGDNEYTLLDKLPNKFNPKLNWHQNSGVLRQEMSRGVPIRDASVGSDGQLIQYPGSFLNAERNLLETKGWTYDPKTTLWSPGG